MYGVGAYIRFELGPVKSYNTGVSFTNSAGVITGIHDTGYTVMVDAGRARIFVMYENVKGLAH